MSRKLICAASLLVLLVGGFSFHRQRERFRCRAPPISRFPRSSSPNTSRISPNLRATSIHDNFISNETSYLHVIPELRRQVKPGFVYLGVGPDQNFSYIVHTQPVARDHHGYPPAEHAASISCIRRCSTSAIRVRNSWRCSSPVRRPGRIRRTPLRDLLRAIRNAPDRAKRAYRTNIAAIRERLLQTYGLKLSAEDLQKDRIRLPDVLRRRTGSSILQHRKKQRRELSDVREPAASDRSHRTSFRDTLRRRIVSVDEAV